MRRLSITVLSMTLCLIYTNIYAQNVTTLYYDQNGKGLDTKKNAVFYRQVKFDDANNPTDTVEDFHMNGVKLAKGKASLVDKFNNHNSAWIGKVFTYDEKGKLSGINNYDIDGLYDGIQLVYNSDGIKSQELE